MRRTLLRCNHKLSYAFLTSRAKHSHNIQNKQPCANTQNTTDVNLSLIIDLCFQQHSYFKFNSLWTDVIKNLWSVWMRHTHTNKNPLQKVFTLHYWRFFWFKYLFSLFLYYSDMFMILFFWEIQCWGGDTGLGRDKGLRLSGKQRSSHTHTLYTPGCILCMN